jgi:hypothetical protein
MMCNQLIEYPLILTFSLREKGLLAFLDGCQVEKLIVARAFIQEQVACVEERNAGQLIQSFSCVSQAQHRLR